MAYGAPNGGVVVNDGDLVGINAFELPAGFNVTNTTIDTTFLVMTDNDSGKFNYFTPRMAGVQVGVSFIPNFEPSANNNRSTQRIGNQPGPGGNGISNGYSVAANYVREFDGIGIAISGGWLRGDINSGEGSTNPWGASGGMQVSYAGFTLGGSYGQQNGDAPDGYSFNGQAWDVGASYTTGPYTVGITYIKGENDGLRSANETQFMDQGVVSGTYNLGPGVDWVGGIFLYDANGEKEQVAGTSDIEDNSGWGVATGLKLSF
jgi:predicted porin